MHLIKKLTKINFCCSRDSLVMISGGSGITPFISIIREIIFRSTQSNKKVPKVLLVAAFKNTTDLTMLDLLLPLSGIPTDISKLQIQIEAYVTQEHERPLKDSKNQIQTKLFKPNPSDSPISAVLGKNGWLWLGAIISSSFFMFLLLLGFVTRYQIYPVEQRKENYHYSYKILWDMFLVCVSVFVATSAVFLWQKRKLSVDQKQIKNVDFYTPTKMSPSSWLSPSDRELESLPHQSLVQSTTVHYGARPDLKSILDDRCKESEVGVLVSGPKSLRNGVAKICASGSAKNLSFEAMSFTWWEVKLDSVALMLGLVGNICLSFLFFPINRGSSILRLVGVTSESSVKYHIWLGHTVLTLFTAHGVCYIIYWATTHQISEMLKWDRDGISNVAGEVALLSGIVMWITSHSLVRRKIFELFFYTHHLYIVFVFFFILHVGFSYSCIMLPGFYLFIIDRFLRFLQSQQRVFLISARVLPCHALELNFSKDPKLSPLFSVAGLSYNPSSIVFIKVKSISKLQWHPFTVTSNSKMDPHQLSIVIKSEGTWSRNLYENLSSPTPIERLEISVEGPYSPTSTSSYLRFKSSKKKKSKELIFFFNRTVLCCRHEMLVMVSGGSGVTPFISIIRELVFIANTDNEKNIPRIILVAAFKKSEDLAMLDLLLPFSRTSHDVSRVQIQIQAYVTRDKNPTTEKGHKTIWFKPSVSDKPISVVLAGSRSWLWLGAIISSSFIVFLLLIGLINRYYIYPIDHNTYLKYSQAARSTITTSVLCASVVITATLAFLWNKNKNNKDKNQIQSADSSNQVPEPWLYEVDRELGSFPNQSLKRVTTVHYGERPNMKKILSECEELNVGVLVSGPKKMRQEVAAICCSSKNLHYESFSFNW
ncbi:PREDICTED: ferric reduction oxidase 4-like [Erythranthe guttata]|uniref:ferric reduction oxidase 4-like n=1 Tax=Erythranthe guttata TaxID=4155 RepID=UPI00064D838F|nr:PREDICTED: ferric reduction oxidase 4-like [Erythranthe guttata]|eukprot:XP_012851922.1 PREDICTED: ferric reduction oxidase 4-like [Erythranthe guttata]